MLCTSTSIPIWTKRSTSDSTSRSKTDNNIARQAIQQKSNNKTNFSIQDVSKPRHRTRNEQKSNTTAQKTSKEVRDTQQETRVVHYTAVFQSSVGYPLSMCHLSQHQLHNLQKKYIPTLMNKMGIARTHAHALVFGPRSYGGIGCNDLRIEQGLDAVHNLIRQLRTPRYNIIKNSTKCIRTVTTTNAISHDKSTTLGGTLLRTYKKISRQTQSQLRDRLYTMTNVRTTRR
jgi:hypothetical protein